jgi:hypothetical protein
MHGVHICVHNLSSFIVAPTDFEICEKPNTENKKNNFVTE